MMKVKLCSILAGLLLLLLISACSKEQATEADVPNPPPEKLEQPFAFTYPVDTITVLWDDLFILRWSIRDSSLSKLLLFIQPGGSSGWTFVQEVDALRRECPLYLSYFEWESFRFLLCSPDAINRDTSAFIAIFSREPTLWDGVTMTEPRSGSLRLTTDSNFFRWTLSEGNPQGVGIEWSPAGKNAWMPGWYGVARYLEDQWPDVPPFPVGSCIDFRMRAEEWSRWTYARNVGYGEFRITAPKIGDTFYRWLRAKITISVNLPKCLGIDPDTAVELSVDGGVSWSPVLPDWVVTQEATTQAYVRLRRPDRGHTRSVGPFRIEDRSTEFLRLFVDQDFRFLHCHVNEHFGSDTTFKKWIRVTLTDKTVTSDRTEYLCSIVTETVGGRTEVSSGLLWQEHGGQRMITGDFLPFSAVSIPGVHDPTVTEIKSSTQPLSLLQRGKGVTLLRYTERVVQFPGQYILKTEYLLR